MTEYSKDSYKRVSEEYATKYKRAQEAADQRRAELHARHPDLGDLDRALGKTGAKIALAAIGTGEGWRERLQAVTEENLALQAKYRQRLLELGYPEDYTMPQYECPKCKDSGFVDNKMCECLRRDLILAAFENSGLGALMRTQSFESFDLGYYSKENGDRERMQRNLELLQAYATQFTMDSPNLVLCGATGLGKTHLSTAVARKVIENGYDVFYTTAIGMLSDFEHMRFGQGAERPTADPARYTDCDLLILDDLGTEVVNQFTNACIYNVINNRINLRRPTIISTNLTGKELQARYTDRITSRILGEFKPLLFVGTDVRLKKITAK